jgi:hypothetical protein
MAATLAYAPIPAHAADSGNHYFPVTPCRIVDTRNAGGKFQPGETRPFGVKWSSFTTQGGKPGSCGVAAEATAAMLNFVSTESTSVGFVQAWAYPTTAVLGSTSVLGYGPVVNLMAIANGIALPICDQRVAACDHDIFVYSSTMTHVVIDVVGYFAPAPPGIAGPPGESGLPGSSVGPAGPTGAQGAANLVRGGMGLPGMAGPTGPTGPAGYWGINGRGTWGSNVLYTVGDTVVHGGTAYIAIADSTSVAPPNASFWALFAVPGAAGAEGPQGQQGPPGTPGSLRHSTVTFCTRNIGTGSYPSCGCSNVLERRTAPDRGTCSISSDTGTCTANSCTGSTCLIPFQYGVCCRCRP